MVFPFHDQVPLQLQFLGGLIVFLPLVTSHVTQEKLTSSLSQRKRPTLTVRILQRIEWKLCLIKLVSVTSEHTDTLRTCLFFSVFLSKQIYWVEIIFGIKSETSNTKSNFKDGVCQKLVWGIKTPLLRYIVSYVCRQTCLRVVARIFSWLNCCYSRDR